ncbi:MAG: discoidin domain-containing protein, partial [Massilia sp.]
MNNFQQSPILKRIHAYGGMTLVAAALGIGNVNAQSINLAANRPAMASSFQTSTMVPASVVDGDPKTRWSSTFSNTEWIQIDLGSVQSFNSVLLDWETAFARAYSLQVSTNGSAWTTVFSTKTGLGGAERIDFPATNARFVRMVGTQRATNWGYSLIEFKVSNEPKRTVVAAVNPLPTDAIFAPTSFWYQVIPTNVTLHPNSAMFTADVERQIKAYYGNVTINTTSYASPVYVAPANTPTAAVRFWDCQNKRYTDSGLVQQWSAVPMPTHAQPAVGTDSEMTVYQPSTD